MAIDFPASPTVNDTHTVGSTTWTWDGTKWEITSAGGGGATDNITEGNTTAEVVDTGSDGHFKVTTEGTERLRVDASGRLLVGTTASRLVGTGAPMSIQHETGLGGISLVSNSNDGESSYVCLGKSRGGTLGSNAILQSGDTVGRVVFAGTDGTDMRCRTAEIASWVDGTTGVDNMPGRLVFSTTPSGAALPVERMRISNQGDTSITCARQGFPGFKLTCSNATNANGLQIQYSGAAFNNTINEFIECYDTAATRFKVLSNGTAQNSTGTYTTVSDGKLKENIVDANSQWDDIKSIAIRNWNFKEETGQTTIRQIGPVAQELELICPELVFDTPDRDRDGNDLGTVTKGVKQSVLYMKAVKALQEAMERIETLETTNASQAATIAAIEARLTALEGGN